MSNLFNRRRDAMIREERIFKIKVYAGLVGKLILALAFSAAMLAGAVAIVRIVWDMVGR